MSWPLPRTLLPACKAGVFASSPRANSDRHKYEARTLRKHFMTQHSFMFGYPENAEEAATEAWPEPGRRQPFA